MSVRSLRYNTIEQHFTKSALASTDRDALAFLEAAQIYNTNQQRAIVNLVRSLKRVGLWSKMKAIYPFVGGTATSHKWNLKDPRDVDAAYRLTFSGGWTHNSSGALGNASNTVSDTFITPTTHLAENSTHMCVYCVNNSQTASVVPFDMGVGSAPDYMSFAVRLSDLFLTDQYYRPNSGTVGTNRITSANTDSRGFYLSSRTTSTVFKGYKNASQIGSTNTNTSRGWSSLTSSMGLGCLRDAGTLQYSTGRQYAFASIGDGLSDTDATNLYNIVDLYQKRLGRAV